MKLFFSFTKNSNSFEPLICLAIVIDFRFIDGVRNRDAPLQQKSSVCQMTRRRGGRHD